MLYTTSPSWLLKSVSDFKLLLNLFIWLLLWFEGLMKNYEGYTDDNYVSWLKQRIKHKIWYKIWKRPDLCTVDVLGCSFLLSNKVCQLQKLLLLDLSFISEPFRGIFYWKIFLSSCISFFEISNSIRMQSFIKFEPLTSQWISLSQGCWG